MFVTVLSPDNSAGLHGRDHRLVNILFTDKVGGFQPVRFGMATLT